MTETVLTVVENKCIARDVYRMVLEGDTSALTCPGQFVNFKLEGFYLRRPISVCDWEEGTLTVIYKTVGAGTEAMSRMAPGTAIDTLMGLGNGFDVSLSGEKPLLIGGGVGVPPMYALCKELVKKGVKPQVVLGFNNVKDVFYEDEFKALGADVYVTTADGSYGIKGFVTDAMSDLSYTYFYTCGPMPMFLAIERKAVTSGEYSFEERMGCGFGACMGCSCKTLTGNKRICKEGPVMKREEILWPTHA